MIYKIAGKSLGAGRTIARLQSAANHLLSIRGRVNPEPRRAALTRLLIVIFLSAALRLSFQDTPARLLGDVDSRHYGRCLYHRDKLTHLHDVTLDIHMLIRITRKEIFWGRRGTLKKFTESLNLKTISSKCQNGNKNTLPPHTHTNQFEESACSISDWLSFFGCISLRKIKTIVNYVHHASSLLSKINVLEI